MVVSMSQFDANGNSYRIVEAHCRPGTYHVNLTRWNDSSRCYEGAVRVLSGVSLAEAKEYVADECTASATRADRATRRWCE